MALQMTSVATIRNTDFLPSKYKKFLDKNDRNRECICSYTPIAFLFIF